MTKAENLTPEQLAEKLVAIFERRPVIAPPEALTKWQEEATDRAAEMIREWGAEQRHEPDEAAIRERCEKVQRSWKSSKLEPGSVEAQFTLIFTDIPALLDKLTALREKGRALVEATDAALDDLDDNRVERRRALQHPRNEEMLNDTDERTAKVRVTLQAFAKELEEPCQKK